ncbi:LytTR family transcriptional regulator DNA-binding domain-containing protein [Pedobacter agri]|uniref:LytTR family transcriptional regulator DNA-binding domain-containing protein n=1 Tax=Pedobacter agri TaxID=454586 RepID=UPI003742661E
MILKLKPKLFLQCHHSYLVNLNYMFSIVGETIILNHQTIIPIGQFYKKQIMEKLNL